MTKTKIAFGAAIISALAFNTIFAADAAKMKMTTSTPPEITTPDSIETRFGTLRFFDGLPDQATVQKLYDNLDFMRGVEVFLNTMAGASTQANIQGLKSVGANNQTVVIHVDRVDAKTLLLTPNTQTATLWGFFNLKDGVLPYEYNLFEIQRTQIKARGTFTTGRVKIEVTTQYAVKKPAGSLDVTPMVNGEEVAKGQVPVSAPLGFTANDCLDVGTDLGSTVALDYHDRAPFAFKGRIHRIHIAYAGKQPGKSKASPDDD